MVSIRNIRFVAVVLLTLFLLIPASAHALEKNPGGVVLALSGGGTRGLAHVGVLKVLEEECIPIAGIVGTSMGAIIGGTAACGYSSDQIERIVDSLDFRSLFSDRKAPSASPLGRENSIEQWSFYRILMDEKGNIVGPMGGLTGLRLYDKLSEIVRPCSDASNFDELPIPFAAVATDLLSGKPVIIRKGRLADAMRASMSIPGLFEPWRIDGRMMVDGGLVANMPVWIAKKIFPGYPVIAVDITAANKTEEEINTAVDVIDQCINIMTSWEHKKNLEAADLVIKPNVSKMPMLDTSNLDAILRTGYETASSQREDIRDLAADAPYCSTGITKRVDKILPDLDERASKNLQKPDDRRLKTAKDYKYETVIGGSYSSFHGHNWLYTDVITRDFLEKDDTLTSSIMVGKEWGIGAEYLDPGNLWKQRTETAFSIRRRIIEPRNARETEWYRFSGAYTERFFVGPLRAGLGIAAEYYDSDNRSDTYISPLLFLMYNSLDDNIDPSEGTSARLDLWWPDADEPVARINYRTVHSSKDGKTRFIIRGGGYIGSVENPYYSAYLGAREELYSIADHPYRGENMAWWRATMRRVVSKNWWGTINADLFLGQGYLLDNSFNVVEDPWETGIALSVPGALLNAKVIAVYNEDEDWTFGVTFGVPVWDTGVRQ